LNQKEYARLWLPALTKGTLQRAIRGPPEQSKHIGRERVFWRMQSLEKIFLFFLSQHKERKIFRELFLPEFPDLR
jgi:hypothetical protein